MTNQKSPKSLEGDDPVLRYVNKITQNQNDPTYSILRSHLLFEELLRDFIQLNFLNPEALEGARLTFSQTLSIARAGALFIKPNDWYWTALEKLNKLRNLLAHHIEAEAIKEKVNSLADFIINEINRPLPEPAYIKKSKTENVKPEPPSNAIYTKIDMALAGLYGMMMGHLQLEKAHRIIQKEAIDKSLPS